MTFSSIAQAKASQKILAENKKNSNEIFLIRSKYGLMAKICSDNETVLKEVYNKRIRETPPKAQEAMIFTIVHGLLGRFSKFFKKRLSLLETGSANNPA